METRVVALPEMKVLGVPIYGKIEEGGPGKAWSLMENYQNLSNWNKPYAYGFEFYGKEFHSKEHWFYMAAREIDNVSVVPSGCFYKVIPANNYLVAKCAADPKVLAQTFQQLYSEVIPNSSYEVCDWYDFEFYGNDFKGMQVPDSYIEIYIPVRLTQ